LIDITEIGGCMRLKEETKESEGDGDSDAMTRHNSRILQGHTKSIVDMKVCYSKSLAATVAREEEGMRALFYVSNKND